MPPPFLMQTSKPRLKPGTGNGGEVPPPEPGGPGGGGGMFNPEMKIDTSMINAR
jgi:hypothetical protein